MVVETNVHYPTDVNRLFDAIRETLEICAQQSDQYGLSTWRQSAYLIRQFKQGYRRIQKLKHFTSRNEQKCEARRAAIEQAHKDCQGRKLG